MKIKDIVDNIGKKKLIIISSIFIALLILIAIVIVCNSNKKKPNKTSAKVTDSSMIDESSDNNSSDEDSSSADNSKTDSKTDSSSVLDKDKPTVTVTTKTPSVKPTTPENINVKFEVVGFQSANTTTKYKFSVPLFERIYGKTKNINGSMGKYLQQGDIVKIKISSSTSISKIETIGDVSVLSFENGIATIKISNTARKNLYNDCERLPFSQRDTDEKIELITNDQYVYKADPNIKHGIKIGNSSFMFGVFDKFNWDNKEADTFQTIASMYISEKGLCKYTANYRDLTYGYTNGDVNKSYTKCISVPYTHDKVDDSIIHNADLYTKVFSTIDFYKTNGYKVSYILKYGTKTSDKDNTLSYVAFVAKK